MVERASRSDEWRVASPCRESWEEMSGDEEVRFCSHCRLSVHNLTRLTRTQAASLVARSQGRLCVRYEQRPSDERIIFRDEAARGRGVWRRARLLAGTALAALLGLSSAAAQHSAHKSKSCPEGAQIKIKRSRLDARRDPARRLTGVVYDPNGAVIVGAHVVLRAKAGEAFRVAETNEEGAYKFDALDAGTYTLTAESPGFQKVTVEELSVGEQEEVRVDVTVPVESTEMVGILVFTDDFPKPHTNLVMPIDKAPLSGLSGPPR